MQPYAFPYLNYFQLIEASSAFVFYDDVQYIKRGWINRNQILHENEAHLFTIPVSKSSQTKTIREVQLAMDKKWLSKFYKQLTHSYSKAPQFEPVMGLINSVFEGGHTLISELAIASICAVFNYLEHPIEIIRSSQRFAASYHDDRAGRLIRITKELGFNGYLNAPGSGRELYDKQSFRKQGVELAFVQCDSITYPQFSHPFVPNLSIIDVLMFNDKANAKRLFKAYTLT